MMHEGGAVNDWANGLHMASYEVGYREGGNNAMAEYLSVIEEGLDGLPDSVHADDAAALVKWLNLERNVMAVKWDDNALRVTRCERLADRLHARGDVETASAIRRALSLPQAP